MIHKKPSLKCNTSWTHILILLLALHPNEAGVKKCMSIHLDPKPVEVH